MQLGESLPTGKAVEIRNAPKASRTKFIVEFEPTFEKDLHKRVLDSSIDSELHTIFDHELFKGMSMSMEDTGEDTLDELRRKPGIRQVWRASQMKKRDAVNATQLVFLILIA